MRYYTVHEPPEPPADRIDRAERLVLVRDGFDWSTLFFTPVTLLMRGLYVGFIAYVGLIGVMVLLLAAIDADAGWVTIAIVALNVMFAYEIGEFQRRKLTVRGSTMLGTVSGRSRYECERRFLELWLPGQPMIRMARRQHGAGAASPPTRPSDPPSDPPSDTGPSRQGPHWMTRLVRRAIGRPRHGMPRMGA